MTKRKKFIVTSVLLSIGFVIVQLLPDDYKFLTIGGLGALTVLLFSWSLYEGLGWNMTLLSLVLPVFFTVGVGLFWFLLPASIFARIPIILFYGMGIYSLCLTTNIYTVSAIRTIALLRAARGVGFVLSLITFFLILDTIMSLRWAVLLSFGIIFLSSIPLYLQAYWTISLEKGLSLEIISTSLISALIMAEVAVALFFWPTTVVVGSLFLTVTSYVLMGLGQSNLEGRLFAQTAKEYLVLTTLVFLGMFFATHWNG